MTSSDKNPAASEAEARKTLHALNIDRVFSSHDTPPFDEIEWETRDAAIRNHTGEAIFEQLDVEFPKAWSQLATNVVASKYFYGDVDQAGVDPAQDGREHSLKQLVHRVTRTLTDWGTAGHYFASDKSNNCAILESNKKTASPAGGQGGINKTTHSGNINADHAAFLQQCERS